MIEEQIQERSDEIRTILKKHTLENLSLGYEYYVENLSGNAWFSWSPSDHDPKSLVLEINEMSIDHSFSNAKMRAEMQNEKEKHQQEMYTYEEKWQGGMISPDKYEAVQEWIDKGFVPEYIQGHYQASVSHGQFFDIFVTGVLGKYNEKLSRAGTKYTSELEFKSLTRENFLSKIDFENPAVSSQPENVQIAYALGLINSGDVENLRLDAPLTRKEAAVYLGRYIQAYSQDRLIMEDYFEDVSDLSDEEGNYVERVYGCEFIDAYKMFDETPYGQVLEKGAFNPGGNMTVEDAILAMTRMDKDRHFYFVKPYNTLILRGFIPVQIHELMSGFVLGDKSVAMKRSGYDGKYYSSLKANEYEYYINNSFIIEENSEGINGLFLNPTIDVGDLLNLSLVDKILRGVVVTIDYDFITVDYNSDDLLVKIERKDEDGLFTYRSGIEYEKNSEFYPIEAVSSTQLVTEMNKHKSYIPKYEEEKKTYLAPSDNIYPKQWMTLRDDGEYEYSDLKFTGTKYGYALGTDHKVEINGQEVEAYNIGGLLAIELDALGLAGYTYDVVSSDIIGEGYHIERGEIKLYAPKSPDDIKPLTSIDQTQTYEPGQVAYELIGDKYDIGIYVKDTDEKIGAMRSFLTDAGKQLILVNALTRREYFQMPDYAYFDHGQRHVRSHQVEGSGYPYMYTNSNHLAIFDRRDGGMTKITLLSYDELNALDSVYKIINAYPHSESVLLDEFEQEAWQAAKKLVSESINDKMSPEEKIIAIGQRLKSSGYLLDGLMYNSMYRYNFDGPYEALVEGYANQKGWVFAFDMCLGAAGLTEYADSVSVSYIPPLYPIETIE